MYERIEQQTFLHMPKNDLGMSNINFKERQTFSLSSILFALLVLSTLKDEFAHPHSSLQISSTSGLRLKFLEVQTRIVLRF